MFIIIVGAVVLLALIVLLIVVSFTLVRQSTAIVVERLGKFHRVLGRGIHFIIPIIDRRVQPVTSVRAPEIVTTKVDGAMVKSKIGRIDMWVTHDLHLQNGIIDLKETYIDVPPQAVITKDNAVVEVNAVVFLQVTDPKNFVYGARDPLGSVGQLTVTSLRNIIGELELDGALTSREYINKKLCYTLDEAADAWGLKIMRVEVQDIDTPNDIQAAMHKQMMAERERRAKILEAEGIKQAEILKAEGERQAEILKAEGRAQAIKMINEASPSAEYLTLEGYKAVKDLADGKATKIVVPSEIQNISGLLAGLKAVVSEENLAKKPEVDA